MAKNREDKLDKIEGGGQSRSPFWDLPAELRQYIFSFLPANPLFLFSRTCKAGVEETILPILLHVVAHAKPLAYNQRDKTKLAAEKILQLFPDLLFEHGYTKDPAGNRIYGSAWRIAWAAGDTWMLKMMIGILPKIENGVEIANEQYIKQFPGESRFDTRNKKQMIQLEEDLQAIAGTISVDPCSRRGKATKQETVAAINRLKEHFSPKNNEVISTGMHSPPEILQRILEFYFKYWEIWFYEQLALYSYEVVGAAEAVATAVDAQIYKQGLQFQLDNNEWEPDRTDSYFCGSRDVLSGLGSSYFYHVYYGELSPWRERSVPVGLMGSINGQGIVAYVRQKNQALTDLRNDYNLLSNRTLEKR